jgi:hypothetical protein
LVSKYLFQTGVGQVIAPSWHISLDRQE